VPQLAYVESSLPGATRRERLTLASQCALALEVANTTTSDAFDPDPYRAHGLSIAAVQAYAMHQVHPLHVDRDRRRQALPHVRDTLQLAAALDAPRVVTVCGFGHRLADRPRERALDFFAALAPLARSLGVRLLIEPLSPARAAAMNDPHEVADLLAALDAPDAMGLVLDTGHLLDSGLDLSDFFESWDRPLDALQLKGRDSAPPDPHQPAGPWLSRIAPLLLSVEHRGPTTPASVRDTAAALRARTQ